MFQVPTSFTLPKHARCADRRRPPLWQKELVDLQADVKKVSCRLAESIAARNAATKNVIRAAENESSLLDRIKALNAARPTSPARRPAAGAQLRSLAPALEEFKEKREQMLKKRQQALQPLDRIDWQRTENTQINLKQSVESKPAEARCSRQGAHPGLAGGGLVMALVVAGEGARVGRARACVELTARAWARRPARRTGRASRRAAFRRRSACPTARRGPPRSPAWRSCRLFGQARRAPFPKISRAPPPLGTNRTCLPVVQASNLQNFLPPLTSSGPL